MTKREAEKFFREEALPFIPRLHSGHPDRVRISEAWGIFTDCLCKDRKITMKQYESWSSPRFCGK